MHFRKIKKKKQSNDLPNYSISGFQVVRFYLRRSGNKVGTNPGQNTIPLQGTLPHSRSFTPGPWRHANSPHVHSCEMCEETWVPIENPRRHAKSVQTPHSDSGQELIFFFFSSTLWWNKVVQEQWYSRNCCVTESKSNLWR